jgi:hypothetical protein
MSLLTELFSLSRQFLKTWRAHGALIEAIERLYTADKKKYKPPVRQWDELVPWRACESIDHKRDPLSGATNVARPCPSVETDPQPGFVIANVSLKVTPSVEHNATSIRQ